MSRLLNTRSIVRIVLSLGLLGFLVWRIDLEQAADALRNADYLFVLPALAIFTLAKLLVARRWRLMMAEFDTVPPLKPLFAILLVSNLANNIVPARLGDLIRVQVPAERYGSSRAGWLRPCSHGIAARRYGDDLAGPDRPGAGRPPRIPHWRLLGCARPRRRCARRDRPAIASQAHDGWICRGMLARLPDRAQRSLETAVPHFIDGLAVFKEMRLAVPAVALSFAIWTLEAVMFMLFGFAFGITLSFPAWLLVMVVANMISSLPIAPSNIGAFEVAVTETLKALGINAGVAGGFAIAAHIFNILWITVIGFGAMW